MYYISKVFTQKHETKYIGVGTYRCVAFKQKKN